MEHSRNPRRDESVHPSTKDSSSGQSVAGVQVTRETVEIDGIGECRVYKSEDEKRYPSVSAVTDCRPNPDKEYGLRNWRRKHDGTGKTEHYSDILKVKSHFGTLAHYHVLSPLTDRELWGDAEETAKRELQEHGEFRGVDAWTWEVRRFEFVQQGFYRALTEDDVTSVLGVERYVLDEDHGYGGQYDLLYTRSTPDGEETVLCDLKTGSGIYYENELQAVAYANAVATPVDSLKIVRAHPDGTDGELEVRTDSDFSSSWEACFEEFTTNVRRFYRRREQATSNATHSDEGSTTETTSKPHASTKENQDEEQSGVTAVDQATRIEEAAEDSTGSEDQLAEAVEMYTGSPVGMGRELRVAVDNGEIPRVIEKEVDGVSDEEHSQVLERLDELLPTFESESSSNESESTSSTAAGGSVSALELSVSDDADAVSNSADTPIVSFSDQDLVSVEVSSTVATLLNLTAAADNQFADSREAVVENALDLFLAPTVGAELDPSQFRITDEIDVAVDSDPVLSQVLDLHVEMEERFEDADDVVVRAVLEYLDTSESKTVLELENYDRYQMVIEMLTANDACPCETIDEVVQAALESHLGVNTDES